MIKKVNALRTGKILALMLGVISMCLFFQNGLFAYYDHNVHRIQSFYQEDEDSLDVVFLGASEVYTGFAPGYAYDKYGFTSYMYSMESNQGSLYKAQLKEIFAYQKPQIVFVEINGFLSKTEKALFDEARLRILTQSMPMSRNKLKTILDHPYEDKLSCIFPLIKYHGDMGVAKTRLSFALRALRAGENGALKGASTRTKIYEGPLDDGALRKEESTGISDMSRYYLLDFIEYCKTEGYRDIVFVNFPRALAKNDDIFARIEQVEEIVDQSGYQFLNLQKETDTVKYDFKKDFQDSHHMNIYGQIKTTEYIGEWVMEQYGVDPILQTSANKKRWDKCASNTREYFAAADQAIKAGLDSWINEFSDEWLYRNAH